MSYLKNQGNTSELGSIFIPLNRLSLSALQTLMDYCEKKIFAVSSQSILAKFFTQSFKQASLPPSTSLLGLLSAILWSYGYFFYLLIIVRWFSRQSRQKHSIMRRIPDSESKVIGASNKSSLNHSLSSEMSYD
jgi:hypothetical protein